MKKSHLIILALLAVFAIAFWAGKKETSAPMESGTETTFCATDVHECPDGSYVSRVAPGCQFAMCSDGTDVNAEVTAGIELIP